MIGCAQETLSRNVMSALEERVSKLEVQVQSSVSRTLHKQVSQVRSNRIRVQLVILVKELPDRKGTLVG